MILLDNGSPYCANAKMGDSYAWNSPNINLPITRHSDRPRENHGEDTVRRLRRLQNVPDSKGFIQRIGRVQLALSSLKMENIPQQ